MAIKVISLKYYQVLQLSFRLCLYLNTHLGNMWETGKQSKKLSCDHFFLLGMPANREMSVICNDDVLL